MPRALAPPPNSGPPTLLPPPLAAEWGLWACRPSSPISRSLVACSCPFISSSRPLVSAIWAPTSLRPSLHLPSSDGSSLASRWSNICRCCACCSREAMRTLALPSFRSHRRERTWGDGLPLAAAELLRCRCPRSDFSRSIACDEAALPRARAYMRFSRCRAAFSRATACSR